MTCPIDRLVCSATCRFYSDEPQKQSRGPDGPGSCVIAQYLRIQIRETRDREMERVGNAKFRDSVSASLGNLSRKLGG